MGISDWIKRKLAILAIATANVEKNALGGENNTLSDGLGIQRYQESNRLSDGLIRGEVTQQVKDMRWRMYKILDEAKDMKSIIVGEEAIGYHVKLDEKGNPVLDENGKKITLLDEDGNPMVLYRNIVETHKAAAPRMSKFKLEPTDDYSLELVVQNENVGAGVTTGMGDNGIVEKNEEVEVAENVEIKTVQGEDGIVETDAVKLVFESDVKGRRTVGEISFEHLESSNKTERTVLVNREFPSKINIENYTEKLVVRKITDEEKLLEFYVSKYVDEYDRKTIFLISEIKKVMKNPRTSNIVDITEVGFLTTKKTSGAYPNKLYEYKVTKFDKIVEYEGYYVIKFKASVLVNGEDVFEKYRVTELDDKYDVKAKKDIR